MSEVIEIKSPEELDEAVAEFMKMLDPHAVYAFSGDMGAGKTTFIAALCRALGVEDIANSPSFSIINEYQSATTGDMIYHFDFYRLETAGQVFDTGASDYFHSGRLCLVEWPDVAESLLPADTRRVKIEVLPDGTRRLTIEG